MTLAKDLATSTALDDGGNTVTLGSFWADRPAVVCLIRHVDSSSCRALVAALKSVSTEIDKRGVRLIVIGTGAADGVREFREAVGYRGPLLLDPSLEVYRAAGMLAEAAAKPPAPSRSGGLFGRMRDVLNADVGKLLAMKQAMTTDLAALGRKRSDADVESPVPAPTRHDSAVFAVGPAETVSFEWRARGAGDVLNIADLLAALPAPKR